MRWPVIAILGFAGACGILEPLGVTFEGHRPMDPVPTVYEPWYEAVEDCLGVEGDYAAVRWYVADAIHSVGRGRRIRGHIRGDEITIDANVLLWSTPRHEAAHHITGIGNELHDEDGRVPCEGAT